MSDVREATIAYRPGDPQDLLRKLRPVLTERHWTEIQLEAGRPIVVRWVGGPDDIPAPAVDLDVGAAFARDDFARHDLEPTPSADEREAVLVGVADLFRAFVIISARRLHPGYVLVSPQEPHEYLEWFGLPPTLRLPTLFGAQIMPYQDVSPHSIVVLGVPHPESEAAQARLAVRLTRVVP